MPNVSIIMPVYNKANYLAKTFNALISQSYCTGQEVDWESIKKYTSALDKFIDKKIEDI